MPTPLLGEIDLHLFGEGKHRRLWDALGANVESRNGVEGVRFAVWAPNARYVNVVGEWNGWDPTATHLEPQGTSGIFAGFAPGAEAGQHYKLVIETPDCVVHWKADPMARRAEMPPGTASIIDGPTGHVWSDTASSRGVRRLPPTNSRCGFTRCTHRVGGRVSAGANWPTSLLTTWSISASLT